MIDSATSDQIDITSSCIAIVINVNLIQNCFAAQSFGLVDIYNLLPQYVVNSVEIHEFQSHLTHMAKTKCSNGIANWREMFRIRR